MKDIGEAYYRWRPQLGGGGADEMEQALVASLLRTCEQAGISNTIELVHPGERFDAARHHASERGVEVVRPLGWIVLSRQRQGLHESQRRRTIRLRMNTFQCTNCGAQIQRPSQPYSCPQCGRQAVGLFRLLGPVPPDSRRRPGPDRAFRRQRRLYRECAGLAAAAARNCAAAGRRARSAGRSAAPTAGALAPAGRCGNAGRAGAAAQGTSDGPARGLPRQPPAAPPAAAPPPAVQPATGSPPSPPFASGPPAPPAANPIAGPKAPQAAPPPPMAPLAPPVSSASLPVAEPLPPIRSSRPSHPSHPSAPSSPQRPLKSQATPQKAPAAPPPLEKAKRPTASPVESKRVRTPTTPPTETKRTSQPVVPPAAPRPAVRSKPIRPERFAWAFPEEPPPEKDAVPVRHAPAVDSAGRIFLQIGGRLFALRETEGKPQVLWEYVIGKQCARPGGRRPGGQRLPPRRGQLPALHRRGVRQAELAAGLRGRALGQRGADRGPSGQRWISAAEGGLLKIDARGRVQEPRPFFRSRQKFDSAGVLVGGVLYILADSGWLFAIAAEGQQGESIWNHVGDHGFAGWRSGAAPAVTADGLLVLAGHDQFLLSFSADGEPLWKTRMPGQTLAHP